MTVKYIREHYGIPVFRGQRVVVRASAPEAFGTVTSASHYVHVRLDGERRSVRFHPRDLDYECNGGEYWHPGR